MSGNLPFGFSAGNGDDDGPGNPFGGFDPASFDPSSLDISQIGAALQQLGQMLQSGSSDPSPVNWELARDTARKIVSQQGDPSLTSAQKREIEQALDLASLWLDPATSFPATSSGGGAWSRSEWIENTLGSWKSIVEPVAEKVNGSMSALMPSDVVPEGLPPELMQTMQSLFGMAKQMGSMMFGGQLGQGLGVLSGEVLGAADIGIPLTTDGRAALLPLNIDAFGQDLGVEIDQVRLYVALRETAAQRLFAHVPWLRSQLTAAVEAYAAGINVDRARIEELSQSVDPNDPESISRMLSSGVFTHEDSPEQVAALARLETLLALVEGWIDDVVTQAATGRLPGVDRLGEAMRRRRASGGPAERTFATLVGLELRPRRLREAVQLWSSVRSARGAQARDELWSHPDLLPTGADLDGDEAIETFVRRSAPLDLSALDNLPEAPREGGPTDEQAGDQDGPSA
jgi:putative hydrolase